MSLALGIAVGGGAAIAGAYIAIALAARVVKWLRGER
jgi:hypothetical protein